MSDILHNTHHCPFELIWEDVPFLTGKICFVTRGPWAWCSADRSRQGKKPEFEMSLPVLSTQYMDMHDYTLPYLHFQLNFFEEEQSKQHGYLLNSMA
jgi:hypothetical protein